MGTKLGVGDLIEIRPDNVLHQSWHGRRGFVVGREDGFWIVDLGALGMLNVLSVEMRKARPFQRVDAGPVTL